MTRKEITEQIKSLTKLLEETPYDETTRDQVEKYLIDREFSSEMYGNEEWFEKEVKGYAGSKVMLSVSIDKFNPSHAYIVTECESGEEIEQCVFGDLEKLFDRLQNFPVYCKYEITPKVDRIIAWRSLTTPVDFSKDSDIERFEIVDTVDIVNGPAIR